LPVGQTLYLAGTFRNPEVMKKIAGDQVTDIPIKDIYNCFRRLKEHRQMFQIEDRQITKIGELFHI
jgi:hypothetical protein